MKISAANTKLLQLLGDQYDPSEAERIARYFWEDVFNYKGGIDRVLHAKEIEIFDNAMSKFKEGRPLQYVTRISYFYDLKFYVDERVLIPRPETEELVHLVLKTLREEAALTVLDVGTGSGCIPITIKKKRPGFQVSGIDFSKDALAVSKINKERHEVDVKFSQLDFLNEEDWKELGSYDVIISNPPYISYGERPLMSTSTLKFEPEMALFPNHDDVLIFYRKLADFGLGHLNTGGQIFMECNEFNANDVFQIFHDKGYHEVEIINDLQGKDRILKARFGGW